MNINYEGLVCYLNSNKNSKQNNVWLDSSGNNNNATLTSFSDNDFNGSYVQFNGNNYAVIPRCIQDDFTLSAEVILESSTSTAEPWQLWYYYASLIDAETAGVRNDFGLTISKDGHAYFGIGNPDRTIPYAQKSLFNEKHIITCTRKKDTGEYAMYIDGILIKKEIHPNKNSLTYPSEIYVGKGINNKFLSMKLFSIRIYNRVLDNFEIKQDSFFVKNKVYVNENNLPIIVDKLTDAKNIKISNNKYGNRVQTVIDKIVEKADDVTKAIEQEVVNDSYSFKVGTGNVDVSTDVEDGFGEVGIKGVTYQNIFKNVHNRSVVIDENSTRRITIPVYGMIKPSTVYTLILIVKSNTLSQPMRVAGDNNYWFNNVTLCKAEETGTFVVSMTSKNTTPANDTVWLGATLGSGRCDFTAILLEGDHTNNPNLPSYFEGIVGVGDKSKNLFDITNSTIGKYLQGNIGSGYGTYGESSVSDISDYIPVVANKTYVFSYDFKKLLGTGDRGYCFYNENKELITSNKNTLYSSTSKKLILTPSVNGYVRVCYDKNCFDIQLEEGSTATSYEPYYDGHKIEILSNGKNLFKPDIVTDTKSYTLHTGNGYWGTVFKVKPNTDYRITSKSDGFNLTTIAQSYVYFIGNGGGECWIVHQTSNPSGDSEGIVNSGSKGEIYIRMPEYTFPIIPYMLIHRKIQIEEGTTGTTYTPYIEDKTQILLDEPLMRLPNGTYDEITRDGKLIRRVGKAVLDGSRKWILGATSSGWKHGDTLPFYHYPDKADIDKKNNGYSLTDRFQTSIGATIVGSDVESFSLGNSNYITIRLNKSRLTTEDAKGFIKWLQQNPTTVYYELETPIITDIIPPSLRIFKDGHLTFNTLVAPESNHVVQLNKSGQIQNAIKESQSLDNRISVLENNYDNLMLSTISRLNDLELDYTLK